MDTRKNVSKHELGRFLRFVTSQEMLHNPFCFKNCLNGILNLKLSDTQSLKKFLYLCAWWSEKYPKKYVYHS